MLSVLDGGEYQLLGDAVAADQFDDDVDFRVGDDGERIVGQAYRTAGNLARQFEILVGDNRNLNRPAGAARDFLGIALEYGKRAATNSADAQKSNVDRFHFKAFLKQKEGICMPSRK